MSLIALGWSLNVPGLQVLEFNGPGDSSRIENIDSNSTKSNTEFIMAEQIS